MRHKIIRDVFTIIYKGIQQVGFELNDCEKYFYLSPSQIKKNTGVDIYEVEILIGSTIRPTFYNIGETMFNSKLCDIENFIVKDFWITPLGSIEEMRIINVDKIKPFKKILRVFSFNKKDRFVVGFEIGDEKPTFINASRLNSLTMLELSEIHILEGSYICPVYYKQGEVLLNGGVCYKDGIILKALNLRYSDNKEQMHNEFEKNSNNFRISNSNEYQFKEEGLDYAFNPLDGEIYSADWIMDVFGMDPDDDIPWGNID